MSAGRRPAGQAGASLDLTCTCCGEPRKAADLDRLLWCEECIANARSQAKRFGWRLGGALAAGLAAWIFLVQRPSEIVIGGWIGAVVATLWLGARAGRAIWFGVLRFRARRPPE